MRILLIDMLPTAGRFNRWLAREHGRNIPLVGARSLHSYFGRQMRTVRAAWLGLKRVHYSVKVEGSLLTFSDRDGVCLA